MSERGRPSSYKAEYADLARKFCMLGATDDDLARLLEVPREALDAWLAEVPEFAAAVKAGRDVADATVADRLYTPPSATATRRPRSSTTRARSCARSTPSTIRPTCRSASSGCA